MPHAVPAHRERSESAAALREGKETHREPVRRRPVHDAVQQDREADAENDHHGLYRQLRRKHPDADPGEQETSPGDAPVMHQLCRNRVP